MTTTSGATTTLATGWPVHFLGGPWDGKSMTLPVARPVDAVFLPPRKRTQLKGLSGSESRWHIYVHESKGRLRYDGMHDRCSLPAPLASVALWREFEEDR